MAAVMPVADTGTNDGSQLAQALESEEQKAARLEKLDALGTALAKTRSEAIQARQLCGVEQEWAEDEEFYQSIDDANRHEHRSVWHTKPMGQAAPTAQVTTRSTVFPNITGPYCDAAAARIADMLLPTDDRNFAILPTPIPDLIEYAAGDLPKDMQQDALAMHGGDEKKATDELAYAINEAKRIIDEAKKKADKAQERVTDWHIECRYHSHVRQVIEDSARIGCGVLKGPIPVMRKGIAYLNRKLHIKNEIKPASKRIDPWNFYPDGACGENIQNGSYTWERDHVTRKQLRELKKQPGYIAEHIDVCMQEGPLMAEVDWKQSNPAFRTNYTGDEKRNGKFEIWYYHGTLERDELEAAGVDTSEVEDPNIPALITMVNNHVIRASLNPLDTGSFPYDVMVWRPRSNHWTGIGVARQIRTPQRIVIAATRNLMDNAGLAAGPMLVLRQGVIKPADGIMGFGPRKVYYIAQDADEIADVKAAIGTIKVDMLVNELMEIIKLGLQLAEDVTGLPMLLQGQQGKAPDTVGGMQMLNNNASAVLRRLARLFDDRVTEPHVTRYYEWLLQYGEDSEKGDYQIDARGSSALVERDIQNQELAGLVKLSLDMRFGLDPKRVVEQYLRSRHFDPKNFEFEDEQWQKILAEMSKGPKDVALQIAALRTQSTEKLAKFWSDMEKEKDRLTMQFEEQEHAKDRALTAWLAELDQQGTKSVTLDEIKAKLADTTIKTTTQKQLSAQDGNVRAALKPPTEPAGRARPGKSFQQ